MGTLTGEAAAIESAWQSIAALKPRLVSHVEIEAHRYRGETWYVISNPLRGQQFRCSPAVYQFLQALDGQTTIDEAWASTPGSDTDTQEDRADLMRLLGYLQEAQLLGGAPLEDADIHFQRLALERRRRWWQRLASPLAIRLPLLDPDRLLSRLAPAVKPLLRMELVTGWLLLVAAACLSALYQWPALVEHWQSRFLDAGNLLTLWLLYPLVKALHELAHGVVAKAWGAEVHEMGVMFLVFTPVPYVDASASSLFPSHRRRAAVAAAGIFVEMLLAAIALAAWTAGGDGLLHDLAFNVLVICGVSTLLFNGNPLLRFDGYYVLSDLVETPNLRARAVAFLGDRLGRRLYGIPPRAPAPASRRERLGLVVYALASGTYRVVISFTIALFVAGKFFVLGVLLALWTVCTQLALPLYRVAVNSYARARHAGCQQRFAAVTLSLLGAVLLLLFALPVGHHTRVDGVVRLPEDTRIRASADGFVARVHAIPGERVEPGDLLLTLHNDELAVEVERLEAALRELELRYDRAIAREPAAARSLRTEIASTRTALARARDEFEGLVVSSKHAGVFTLPPGPDPRGRFKRKGDLLALVVGDQPGQVQVVVPQQQIDDIRRAAAGIEVRLHARSGRIFEAGVINQTPLAISELPSHLLGSSAGGRIPVDARDEAGRRTINRVFQVDLRLPADTAGIPLGQRASVRFQGEAQPLGFRLLKWLRQGLLARFDV